MLMNGDWPHCHAKYLSCCWTCCFRLCLQVSYRPVSASLASEIKIHLPHVGPAADLKLAVKLVPGTGPITGVGPKMDSDCIALQR